MCGIAGLFLKHAALRPDLGRLFEPMLHEMTSRGPDSAGIAVYRDPVPSDRLKLSLASDLDARDWTALLQDYREALDGDAMLVPVDSHAILTTAAAEAEAKAWFATAVDAMRVVGAGRHIEIFKATGAPRAVFQRFGLERASGSHMIGHTRMATESAVTTAGSHPFATGADLCLVHNGSLSNHNRLRARLMREGIRFDTDNDSEVAAAYLTSRLRAGDDLETALYRALADLDGFYTFCVGTADGFAVLRDPIACKHAVLAETDDWVAMATEYRAIATLPGAERAHVTEPAPATVYYWGRQPGKRAA